MRILVPHGHASGADWETLTGCRLLKNPSNDGDSFHVEHQGREYIFRLYFVDAPEPSREIPARVGEQAEVFGVSPERVIKAGQEAAAFTARNLSRPFTIRTKWQDAEGQSRLPRQYAFVETVDKKDLGELLAAAGFARSYGAAAAPPGESASALRATYDRLAARSKASRLGAWGVQRAGAVTKLENLGGDGGKPPDDAGELGILPELPAMDTMLERMQFAPDTESGD